MTETVLKSLMRLFAIASNINNDIKDQARQLIKSYLDQQFKLDIVEQYMVIYDFYFKKFRSKEQKKQRKQLSLNSVKVIMICEEVNKELPLKQRFLVLIQLLEIISYSKKFSEMELDFVKTISDSFKIPSKEFYNCKSFIFNSVDEIPNRNRLLIIDNEEYYNDHQIKHLKRDNLHGKLFVLFIASIGTYSFKYFGKDELYYNGIEILENKVYIFNKGASIQSLKSGVHSVKMANIYYNDIVSSYLSIEAGKEIVLTAHGLEFTYKSGKGIRELNFTGRSGEMIGVMGISGVGKTTFLNMLNGNIAPDEGRVMINGYDVDDDKDKLIGIIGYVPQDDLLIEELTVYQNLYFNSKLCFSEYSEFEIENAINRILTDLELYDVRNQKVGSPLKNFISGGQRKRLNIAMELIREPAILLVDEPTSGLSSKDSDNVMELLKEQTLKGKLVIANIHQPSSDTFKMFDQLFVLDTGGLPIYYGNPIDAVVYFKTLSHQINASESECSRCGNIDTEQILDIIESKTINEFGDYTEERKVFPQQWHAEYLENIESNMEFDEKVKEVPKSNFKIPNVFKQFKIFSLRNIFSKITDVQYLLISLLEAPALALILGYFTKYNGGTAANPQSYIFSSNENLPAYIFMSVVVSLFLGLTMSAEEIIKDRRTLKRESFLHLSRAWYLHSKIVYLFGISAFQMFTYVIIGNLVLGIKGLNFEYWLVLFSASCFANMLGLNISSGLKSVITIYILIPFILVPQLLFAGAIVKFDKFHSSVTAYKYVPFVGDMMASRWAYEALSVTQYKKNKYQKYFYDVEFEESNATYFSNYLVPELLSILEKSRRRIIVEKKPETIDADFFMLKYEMRKLFDHINFVDFDYSLDEITIENFDEELYKKIKNDLLWVKVYYNGKLQESFVVKDRLIDSLNKNLGMPLYQLKDKYYNYQLGDITLNKDEIDKVYKKKYELVRRFEPIYFEPESKIGRSHFYAPYKIFVGKKIDTLYFNVIALWIMCIVLYLTLQNDTLKKIISFSMKNKLKLKKPTI